MCGECSRSFGSKDEVRLFENIPGTFVCLLWKGWQKWPFELRYSDFGSNTVVRPRENSSFPSETAV
jgi:hypothetical protein